MQQMKIGTHTAVDWNSFCCEVTLKWFENQTAIGGQDIEVEIDETAIVKRRYNRGRCLQTVWVFGGVERDTKKKFIVPLLKDSDGSEEPENVSRSAENLVPLIKKYILPGSIIYSDKWKAYDSLSSVGYIHFSINHSEKFVEGDVHSQKVERLWHDLKEWIKRPGMKKGHLHHYIGRYLFCTSGDDREQLLHKFLVEAAALYRRPLGCKKYWAAPRDSSDEDTNDDVT